MAASRLCLVGLGKRERKSEEALRVAAAAVTRSVGRGPRLAFSLDGVGIPVERAAEAVTTGRLLAAYRFDRFKSAETRNKDAKEGDLVIVAAREKAAEARQGVAIGRAVSLGARTARDLGNLPGNHGTPRILAREARAMARRSGLRCQVLDEKKMAELGMGSLLSVALGSDEPPRLIILEHRPRPGLPTVCVVGKGLTFDSGGISIKPSADMDKMRYDKCGGCATIGILEAVASLGLEVNVVGIVPSSENLPSGSANKPGDVVTAMNGTTIEILNTDAEGRLILADALCYAQRYKPELILDMATLTGAVLIGLGQHMAGMMGTDEDAMADLRKSGLETHERVWQLPLDADYAEMIKGSTTDIKNLGGRYAGTITAAEFLRHFVGDVPWVHLDIAGVAWDDPKRNYNKDCGATGYAVRLVCRFLQQRYGPARPGRGRARSSKKGSAH
jgi:leucyl aminopeptidase